MVVADRYPRAGLIVSRFDYLPACLTFSVSVGRIRCLWLHNVGYPEIHKQVYQFGRLAKAVSGARRRYLQEQKQSHKMTGVTNEGLAISDLTRERQRLACGTSERNILHVVKDQFDYHDTLVESMRVVATQLQLHAFGRSKLTPAVVVTFKEDIACGEYLLEKARHRLRRCCIDALVTVLFEAKYVLNTNQ